MPVAIVIPTYNERKNISILIPKIRKSVTRLKSRPAIIVVDDNSPDGTPEEVRRLMESHEDLHLLSGKKRGLGDAYIRGFDYAINRLNADVLVQMDADLSHPPEVLPELMRHIERFDVVIGSRYADGGGISDWTFWRRLISSFGNSFARHLSGFSNIHDFTSGYRAIKVPAYRKIEKRFIHPGGYSFQFMLLYGLLSSGAKSKEIPFVFRDRIYGETKLKAKDILEFIANVCRAWFARISAPGSGA